ncbi:acyl-protein synthetase [Sedimentibacter hydroxybenzoicus DSM 7310]|uniref:Acyl-protein synthetase n=1 Tax=Sedimentibacter hydroxybenzoicus DSM 7310 TaxID=1123245 RepID=A0A974GWG1_SEDHY|nr:acyl-protein synthetase [Sedimentibacter hydroxybenzoicus]NYB74020.1 acyl-protein synthetase [Sedimentibacter hydroxybenzoicus DSM 7310]
MSYGNRLFYRRDIYNLKDTDELFFRAIVDNVKHHMDKCPDYASILYQQGFSIEDLKSIEDIYKIPVIPTLFLKNHTLYSSKSKHLMFKSTTSGTSGKVSEMALDLTSSWRGLGMILGTFFTHRLLSVRPTNYVVLGYQPAKRNKMGAVKTAYAITYTAPAVHKEYALKDTGTEYVLNMEGIKNALIKYEKRGLPVRFMGFPAYFMFLLKELNESGIKLKLHPKSLILLAGGWKNFFTEQVDKPTLYDMSEKTLGLGGDRIREFFGAVEHPISYFDCPNHHFHVPIYSRVIIRDLNMKPVDYGVPGMLNLITPMMTSMPFTSVMTDDLAIMHPGEECGCGNSSPYFEILGRVGLADIKTCAANASELLDIKKGGAV